MADLETVVRAALARRLQRGRAESVKMWDDEAVSEIMLAAGQAVIADGFDGALAEVRGRSRAAEVDALAREMLAAFSKGSNGWAARVSSAQVEEWRSRLGDDG